MDSKNENTPQEKHWQERVWVLAVAGQAGIYIAFPVFLGLVIGYFLDRSPRSQSVLIISRIFAICWANPTARPSGYAVLEVNYYI